MEDTPVDYAREIKSGAGGGGREALAFLSTSVMVVLCMTELAVGDSVILYNNKDERTQNSRGQGAALNHQKQGGCGNHKGHLSHK